MNIVEVCLKIVSDEEKENLFRDDKIQKSKEKRSLEVDEDGGTQKVGDIIF